ncbi:MAG: REP-associated tyrosine transposase [Candidatus Gastranaerophilaceae bacterium]
MSNYKRYFKNSSNPVFITFVTYNRREILIQNIEVLRNSFKYAKNKYDFEIIAISVLKEHCHMIISASNPNDIPQIIRTIKFNFSINVSEKFICQNLSESAIKRGEKSIWQRRYYDHIIRNEEDLYKHIDYIHYNPLKHYNFAPKDWKYSSFDKFVQNGFYEQDWCNFEDKYKISNLDYE